MTELSTLRFFDPWWQEMMEHTPLAADFCWDTIRFRDLGSSSQSAALPDGDFWSSLQEQHIRELYNNMWQLPECGCPAVGCITSGVAYISTKQLEKKKKRKMEYKDKQQSKTNQAVLPLDL